jgi:outer membrane protein assembly factor BamB
VAAVTPTLAPPAPSVVDDWLTYHRDNARTGLDPVVAQFAPPRQLWQTAALDGDIYAEPLVAGSHVFAATTNNTVYSLDATTGQVLWQQHLGEPVPRSELPCGDIPITGITSTPVIDLGRGLIYVVPYVQPIHHELVALDLGTGAVRFRRPIDPPGIEVVSHQQRAALSEFQNQIYVAFGGLYGDCGNYHGWLVAANADSGTTTARYQVPTEREGAIWAPGGPSIDATGNVFAATGNGSSEDPSRFDYGDAVLRLSPDLRLQDWFAPTNWAELNQTDADIGSVSPALLGNNLIFQIGKSGVGYLLHANNLGHVGGQAYLAQVCRGAYGGTAYAAPSLYVPCNDGLYALQIQSAPSFGLTWHVPTGFAGPPIVAGGAIWTITREGLLYALDPRTGNVLARLSVGTPTHFATPSASQGRLFVPAAQRILGLSLG